MKPPDHDVCVQTCETDEEGARALVLKTRGVDSHFVESQVVRLAATSLVASARLTIGGVR
jgi:hypothetical protein